MENKDNVLECNRIGMHTIMPHIQQRFIMQTFASASQTNIDNTTTLRLGFTERA